MDGLRQIPGREAIKLRAEVSLDFFLLSHCFSFIAMNVSSNSLVLNH